MSKIGQLPVSLPDEVKFELQGRQVTITGPKGVLSLNLPRKIEILQKDNRLFVSRGGEDKNTKANHGSIRSVINNMVLGVTTPWSKQLEIRGTGYKAQTDGTKLTILAGFIHPVIITAPPGVQFQVAEDTKITVTGCDKVVVGQVASNIRKVRKPEVYKGKGIRYLGEYVKLKPGKTTKA